MHIESNSAKILKAAEGLLAACSRVRQIEIDVQILVSVLKSSPALWNELRKSFPDMEPDLRRAKLAGCDLSGVNLAGTDLQDADLSGANLRGADLSGALAFRANMSRADLSECCLREAILGSADLTEANLGTLLPGGRDEFPA
jgi:uncharacterized protein YjbI with pentapeptide repeats